MCGGQTLYGGDRERRLLAAGIKAQQKVGAFSWQKRKIVLYP